MPTCGSKAQINKRRKNLESVRCTRIKDAASSISRFRSSLETHLVQRGISAPVPPDPPSFAQSLLESLSESQSTVFSRVVIVDVEIPLALQVERHLTVLGERGEHLDLGEKGAVAYQ